MKPEQTPKDYIPKGGFTIARKIFDSNIWIKDPLYLKVWIWIIGQANHSDNKKSGRRYKRGEIVTTYSEIIKATSYYHNRSHISPSLKKIRIILEWLQCEGMILVKPLKSGLGLTRADPTARTRAYIGVKIIVINYDTYQTIDNYKGRDKGRPSVQLGHNNKNDNKNDNPPDVFSLRKRYAHPELIDSVFQAISSTRKSGRVAESVLIAQLQKWERYPVEQVEAGIRIYLENNYADEGKDEKYLSGIIRRDKSWQNVNKCTTPEWV